MGEGSVLIVGGTGGIGREVAGHVHTQGAAAIITGRDPDRSAEIAAGIGNGAIDGDWLLP